MADVSLHARMCPDWRNINPYQQLLADGVERFGGSVSYAAGYKRGLPLWRDWRACSPRPDILHMHWLSTHVRFQDYARKWLYSRKLIFDLGLLRRAGLGLVWTVHNAVPHEARHLALERSLQRRVARKMDRIILHSESAWKEVCVSHGLDREKVRIIPHGHYRSIYGPPADRERAKAAVDLASARRIFLFFGLLRPYKGLDALLGAWKELAKKPWAEGCHLLIAGKAPDETYAAHLRRCADGAERVHLKMGFVAEKDIPVYFGAADFVVLPFQRILTSGSLLLAMGYGVPIVAPGIELVNELLGSEAPLAYDREATDGLREALRTAARMDDSALQRLREDTLQRVEAFSWDRIGRMTMETYGEAMECAALRRA